MNFEAEMSRFEAEIRRASQQQQQQTGMFGQPVQPDPQLDTFIQAQVHARAGLPPPMHHSHPQAQVPAHQLTSPPPSGAAAASTQTRYIAPPKTILSAKRQLEAQKEQEKEQEEEEDIMAKLLKMEKEVKAEKKQAKKAAKAGGAFVPSSVQASTSGLSASSSALARSGAPPPAASISDDTLKKAKKNKRIVRTGGGQIWEDETLKEWDQADFRLFCGDLGNDVTDEVLSRTFGRYASFQKAKVVRCKKTNKTRGYGFVSFREPTDFTRAMKEINGKYVGSRPIKLRKSNWKDRNIDQVRQKQKVKQQMGYKW